nr:immunoglobulin heavy chain junction region [Macaca mulatta]
CASRRTVWAGYPHGEFFDYW